MQTQTMCNIWDLHTDYFRLGVKFQGLSCLIQITSGMKRSRCCTHSAHIQAHPHTHTDSWQPRDTNTLAYTYTYTYTHSRARGAATFAFVAAQKNRLFAYLRAPLLNYIIWFHLILNALYDFTQLAHICRMICINILLIFPIAHSHTRTHTRAGCDVRTQTQ